MATEDGLVWLQERRALFLKKIPTRLLFGAVSMYLPVKAKVTKSRSRKISHKRAPGLDQQII